jgi:hypothetical protein
VPTKKNDLKERIARYRQIKLSVAWRPEANLGEIEAGKMI